MNEPIVCIPVRAMVAWCTVCDAEMLFSANDTLCYGCGSNHPLGDWNDPEITDEMWDKEAPVITIGDLRKRDNNDSQANPKN